MNFFSSIRLRPKAWGIAVLSVAIALLLMWLLNPIARVTLSPFLLFFGAVVVASWWGGIQAGLVASVLSVLVSDYFFVMPQFSFATGTAAAIRLGIFFLECVIISVMCGSLREAHQRLDRSYLKLWKNEVALRDANQWITDILSSITDGFYALDSNWRFVYVNPQTEKILGRSRDTLLGHSIWGVIPDLEGTPLAEGFHQAMQTRQQVVLESRGVTRPDRWFEIYINPLPDGLTVYFRDLTARKKDEQTMRQHMQMLDLANDSIIIRDFADHTISYWNQGSTRQYGWTAEEAIGQNSHELLNTVFPESIDSIRETVLDQGYWIGELIHTTRDRETIAVISRWTLQKGVDGQSDSILEINTDITDRKEAEQALKLSEERYRLLNSTLSAIVWTTDADGKFITPQREWEVYTGQSWTKHQGFGWLRAFHPDDREHVWNQWQGAREQRTAYTSEGRLWHAASQSYRYFEARGMAVFNSDGLVREWIGNITDVHDRRQTEAALRQSEDRLRMAVESARLGIWNWNLTTNELMWDTGCKQMFGLSPDVDITIDVFFDALHPDDKNWVYQVVQRVLDPSSGGYYNIDYRVIGIEDDVERWISAKGQAYYDTDGTPLRFSGIVLDITERKQFEKALMESEAIAVARAEELTALMETTPAAIWIAHDPQCHHMTANQMAYALMGTEPGTVTTVTPEDGVNALPFQHCRNGEQILPSELPLEKAMRTGQEVVDELEFVFPDGSVRYLYGKAVPLYGFPGVVRGAIGGFIEITALKESEKAREQLLLRERQAREEAERANRIKDEFLAILSHELRSPLNPILGWAKLLQTRKFDDDTLTTALATIERNAKLQTQLIDDLLDIARILRGKLKIEFSPVNLADIIDQAVETVKAAAEAKTIHLHSNVLDIGQVRGDQTRLQQVVWNLLSNAIKFTPKGGEVLVRLERMDTQAQISVEDTGKGISPNFLPYIFDSFRQEDASITRRFGGLGLGLAIVRYLVEAHGGTITAHSDGEGLGATFVVQLPLLDGESPLSRFEEAPHQQTDLTGIRVLAVDDDPDAREVLMIALSHHGADVRIADSADEAMAALSTFHPQVLISDIGMPNIDGYMLMQQIRSLPESEGGQIPAIALTAYAQETDQQRAIESGYQRHLSKPLSIDRLVQTVAELAQRSNR
ncbi:MAG: PAS domain S-box protein [Leptolyngbyaceae bacterium]|nr:PAS domain S-box protein [Leptolyngbyaceae bacterium]